MNLDVALSQLSLVLLATVICLVNTATVDGSVNNTHDDLFDRLSAMSLSRSSSSAAADAETVRHWREATPSWRWCYVCSGMSPDRQCELFPQHVTVGPSKVNCTRNYCTAYVRYRPKNYFVKRDRNGNSVARESLTPDDFEVTSVARECEDADRGNACHVDGDGLGATCYRTCTSHYCNDETPRPTWRDFQRHVDDDERTGSTSDSVVRYTDTAGLPPRLQATENGAERRRDRMKGITLYQPNDSEDMMSNSEINDTARVNHVGRRRNSATGNNTATSPASCGISSNSFVVTCAVAAYVMLISAAAL